MKTYLTRSLRPDLLAGLTVAMVVVPQSMAYAAIANLNPIYGIYTAILPAIIAALFGSSNHLVTGPTNAAAMVTFSVLIFYAENPNYQEYVFALTILCGAIILVLGLLKMGGIIRYVSNSVLTGFLAGATVLIILGQLSNLSGIKVAKDLQSFEILWAILTGLPSANLYILVTAAISILVMLFFPRVTRRIPAALITIIISSLLVLITGWEAYGVRTVRQLGLPSNPGFVFHIPNIPLSEYPDLIAGAGAVALLVLVEAISIAKSIGMSSYQRINPSREFVGQGLASFVGGFFMCFPAAGSLSRSAVNFAAKAKTRFSSVYSGIFVWMALLIFYQWIGYIPVPSLAAVVVVSAAGLLDLKHIRTTWRTRSISRITMTVTFLATLFLNLENAIYLGAVLSIIIYLYESSHLGITYLLENDAGQFVEKSIEDIQRDRPEIAIVNVQGNLYFGAVDDFETHLDDILHSGVKVIILRVRRANLVASTGLTALKGVLQTANRLGTHILICGVSEELDSMLQTSGIKTLIGADQLFSASDIVFESTHQAWVYAQRIISREKHT